jgi:hypothetical protein
LFPRVGRGPYPNATEWARDIYRPFESPIREHIAMPKEVRLHWGGLKNVLSGVTTVAHHNAAHPCLFHASFPIRVLRRYAWAHSIAFSPDWRERHRDTAARTPFFIHAGEGTDKSAAAEMDELSEAEVLDRKTVLIHGVAIKQHHVKLMRRNRTALVWCPSSNTFTLGVTLSPALLRSGIPIALGSDSALTGCGDLLDELRFASAWMPREQLYRMLTSEAAKVLQLPSGFGVIEERGPADLVVFRDGGGTPAQTLLDAWPEMVIVQGRIAMVSQRLAGKLRGTEMPSHEVSLAGRGRYLVRSPVAHMVRDTARYLGKEIQLAGKAVLQ